MIQKGQYFLAVSQELANAELLFNVAKIAYETLIQGGMKTAAMTLGKKKPETSRPLWKPTGRNGRSATASC